MTRDEMLSFNATGGLDCPRGCVPDRETLDSCVASLVDLSTDEYPVPVCGPCHNTLEVLADDYELALASGDQDASG